MVPATVVGMEFQFWNILLGGEYFIIIIEEAEGGEKMFPFYVFFIFPREYPLRFYVNTK